MEKIVGDGGVGVRHTIVVLAIATRITQIINAEAAACPCWLVSCAYFGLERWLLLPELHRTHPLSLSLLSSLLLLLLSHYSCISLSPSLPCLIFLSPYLSPREGCRRSQRTPPLSGTSSGMCRRRWQGACWLGLMNVATAMRATIPHLMPPHTPAG